MPRDVFTYGTLMFPAVMRAVTGRSFEAAPGKVTGFVRQGIRDEVFPGLSAGGEGTVEGVVWFAVDDAAAEALDRFEDWLYDRRSVAVSLDDGRTITADAWIVPPRYADALDGAPWDSARFEREELARYLGMCEAFWREDSR